MQHELIEKNKKHTWLPFTQMKDYDENPSIIVVTNEVTKVGT